MQKAREKDEHAKKLQSLTESPKVIAETPEVMKMKECAKCDVGNGKPEACRAGSIPVRSADKICVTRLAK
jgi:hypothetical protein